MTKFCQYCGSPLNEGAKFCTNCGHPVAQAAQPSDTYNDYPNNDSSNNNYQSNNYTNNNPNYQQPYQQPSYTQQPPQQAYAYGGQMPYQQPPKRKGGCGKVALIVMLVIIAVVGAGVYFLYKYAADEFEDAKEKMEETMGQSISTILNSEDNDGNTEMANRKEKTDKSNKAKKSQSAPQIKLKYEMFFDEALPFPDFGEITENSTDFGTQTIRMDKISYAEFVEYCKLLEAQPGWEAHKEDNVAHFPKDYNDKMQTMCVGDYHGLHVVVCYLSDSFIDGSDMPHVRISVKKNR